MIHPSTRQWSDFVRGLADGAAREGMKRHLDRGCERCARQVRALEMVQRVARADRRSPVPAHSVRSARDVFRIQKLLAAGERAPRTLALSFDSFLTPAVAGVRSEPVETRHLVYESPQYMVGLQLHSEAEGEALYVTGQVLDTEDGPIGGVPVSLLESGCLRSHDQSNSQGDFRLRRRSEAPGRLILLLPGDEMVDVEVPGAESRK